MFRHPSTGQVFPWFLKLAGEVVCRDLPPALSTNDIGIELQAVLDGQVIAQLSSMSAAPHIRAGRIVPLLPQHMTDHMSVTLFYGSRNRPIPARGHGQLSGVAFGRTRAGAVLRCATPASLSHDLRASADAEGSQASETLAMGRSTSAHRRAQAGFEAVDLLQLCPSRCES